MKHAWPAGCEGRRVRGYADLAARAVTAATGAVVTLPARTSPPAIIAELATNVPALDQRVNDLDNQIATTSINIPKPKSSSPCPDSAPSWAQPFWSQPVIWRAFPSAGHLAAAAGLVPVPNDRAGEWQPAQAPSLQPPAAPRVLPISADQHDARGAQP